MRSIFVACVVCVMELAVQAHAATQAVSSVSMVAPTLEDMRKRDRYNKPSAELAAWSAFAARVLAYKTTSDTVRAEVYMHLAIALCESEQFDKGLIDVAIAEKIIAASPKLSRAAFVPDLYAIHSELLDNLNRKDEAQVYADKSLAAARTLFGDDSGVAATAYESQSLVAVVKGNDTEARRLACIASDRAQAHLPLNNSVVASYMAACGILKYNLDEDDALDILRKAADIAYQYLPLENKIRSVALNGSGAAMLRLGRYAEAQDIFRREINVDRVIYGENSVDLYYSQSMLGQALRRDGKYEDSEAVLRAAAMYIHRIDGAGGEPDLKGMSYVQLANAVEKQGRYAEALEYEYKALAELKLQAGANKKTIAIAELDVARLLGYQGHYTEALPMAQTARDALIKIFGEQHRTALSASFDYARLLNHMGQTQKAYAISSDAAKILEGHTLDLATKQSDMISLSQIITASFNDHTLIALHNNDITNAVHFAQLASLSELSLVNAELGARAVARGRGLQPLIQRLRTARATQTRFQTELMKINGGGTGDAGATSKQIFQSQSDVTALTAEINTQFPDYAKLSRPQPTPLADIQARLTPAQALIIPLNLPDQVATIAITAKNVFWSEGKGSSLATTALVTRIRKSIDDARLTDDPATATFDNEAAYALYQALLPGHLAKDIADKSEWLFPSSGLASSIPPSLLLSRLPDSKTKLINYAWLIRDHAVAIISDFSLPNKVDIKKNNIRFAGIGNPALGTIVNKSVDYTDLFRGGLSTINSIRALPSLPGSGQELSHLAENFGGTASLLLTQGKATEAAIKALDFSPYSVVMFATHGLTSGEINGLSEPALVMTPPDVATGDNDGLLTASEIAQLTIPADWVILSACNSGSGRNATAPTYSGLARAFRLAGAHSLLLSHWPLRDDAAERLTLNTVKTTDKGITRAQALRLASLKLILDRHVPGGAHPAVWAPFVIVEN